MTPEQRAKYRDPNGKRCDCGQMAVVCQGNDFVCARCLAIQARMYRGHGDQHVNSYSESAYNPDAKYFRLFAVPGTEKARIANGGL